MTWFCVSLRLLIKIFIGRLTLEAFSMQEHQSENFGNVVWLWFCYFHIHLPLTWTSWNIAHIETTVKSMSWNRSTAPLQWPGLHRILVTSRWHIIHCPKKSAPPLQWNNKLARSSTNYMFSRSSTDSEGPWLKPTWFSFDGKLSKILVTCDDKIQKMCFDLWIS